MGVAGLYVSGVAANILADRDAKHVTNIQRVYNAHTDSHVSTCRDNTNRTLLFVCNCDGVFAYHRAFNAGIETSTSNVAPYYQCIGDSKAESP